ncbi:hypothetical protein, partial [Mixta calida]|uniref:hypothetical protein n=1 Tax=Mixta calida TaxID=665913 RepID=UPI0028B0F0F7
IDLFTGNPPDNVTAQSCRCRFRCSEAYSACATRRASYENFADREENQQSDKGKKRSKPG